MTRPIQLKPGTGLKWAISLMILAGILLLAFGFSGLVTLDRAPSSIAEPPIQIGVDIWPGNFWPIVADRQGYFSEEGLSVKLVDVSNDYNQSVNNLGLGNGIDLGLVTPFDLMQQNFFKGGNLVGILYSDKSLSGEGIVAKPEINSLRDLAGKRVGIEKNSYLDYYLTVALRSVGMSESDIQEVNLSTDTMADSFGSQKLDAAFAWEPVTTDILHRYGAKTLLTADQIPGVSWSIWAVRQSLIQSRPDDIMKVLRAWEKATAFLKSNPNEALALISGYSFEADPQKHYSIDELKAMVAADPLMDLGANIQAFSFSSGIDSVYSNLQSLDRYFRNNYSVKKPFDTNAMLDPRFVRTLHMLEPR
jgi:NitT/TauT family transport system substrate-binding protein